MWLREGDDVTSPRLDQGLEVVALSEGIAIVNGGSPVLFQGRAAAEVLTPLLSALDGSLNATGLAAQLGLPIEHVERGLRLLADRGLLAAQD
jgi:hypothetical protein